MNESTCPGGNVGENKQHSTLTVRWLQRKTKSKYLDKFVCQSPQEFTRDYQFVPELTSLTIARIACVGFGISKMKKNIKKRKENSTEHFLGISQYSHLWSGFRLPKYLSLRKQKQKQNTIRFRSLQQEGIRGMHCNRNAINSGSYVFSFRRSRESVVNERCHLKCVTCRCPDMPWERSRSVITKHSTQESTLASCGKKWIRYNANKTVETRRPWRPVFSGKS